MNVQEIEKLTLKFDRLNEILEADIARQKLTVQELKELNKKVAIALNTVDSILNNHVNEDILLN
jgi:hypothetical protein